MSANGATKRDLFRVIAERDAEILRLKELLPTPEEARQLIHCQGAYGFSAEVYAKLQRISFNLGDVA